MTGFPRSLRAATGASRAMLSTSCRASSSPTPGSSLPLSSRVSLVSTSRHGLESRCRCFMTSIQRAQSRKAPGIQPAKKSWAEFEEPVVLTEELARASDLESVIKANGYRHRPSQYIDCTEKFKSVADQYTRPWPFFLAEADRPSPQLIHETACLLRQLRTSDSKGITSLALWIGASELGHIPSTLTARLNLRHTDRQLKHPLLSPIQSRFRSLVAASHPQALAIQGIIAGDESKPHEAIRLIERALSLDRDGSVWRTGCHGTLGEAYLKVGRREEGLKHLEKALEQGMAQYGEILYKFVEDKEEAWRVLYRAACHKNDLFSRLADEEVLRAESTSDKQERAKAYRMASEWTRLADPNVSY